MARFPVLGVTGGIGCGKSEVGRILRDLGVPLLDADEVAHRMLRPGTATCEAIVQAFGPDARGPDGGIDRARVAARVFANAEDRAALNRIVHPPVLREIRAWVAERRDREPLAVIVPLLYEVDVVEPWNAVVCVAARPEIARQRLRDRGWSDEEIERRLAAQWPLDEKARRADFVIWNNGTLDDLEHEVRTMWSNVMERSAGHDR